ncbi:MAG: lipoyl(octanoyl) transferase LipB, partial [Longimicrobiales bacterium]
MSRPWEERTLEVRDLGQVRYEAGLDLQAGLVRDRRAEAVSDVLLLLEHPHVITSGSGGDEGHILASDAELSRRGIEVISAGRGGDVTYHGPGQLVGYAILDLKPDRQDLHRHLRALEGVLISALDDFGIKAEREPSLTGVWVGGSKVGAIGIRVSSGWISSHGFALNVTTDLSYFDTIVPCGIQDRSVTSLAQLLTAQPSMAEVKTAVTRAFVSEFGYLGTEEGSG